MLFSIHVSRTRCFSENGGAPKNGWAAFALTTMKGVLVSQTTRKQSQTQLPLRSPAFAGPRTLPPTSPQKASTAGLAVSTSWFRFRLPLVMAYGSFGVHALADSNVGSPKCSQRRAQAEEAQRARRAALMAADDGFEGGRAKRLIVGGCRNSTKNAQPPRRVGFCQGHSWHIFGRFGYVQAIPCSFGPFLPQLVPQSKPTLRYRGPSHIFVCSIQLKVRKFLRGWLADYTFTAFKASLWTRHPSQLTASILGRGYAQAMFDLLSAGSWARQASR